MLPGEVCGHNETPVHYKEQGLKLEEIKFSLRQRKVNHEGDNFYFKCRLHS